MNEKIINGSDQNIMYYANQLIEAQLQKNKFQFKKKSLAKDTIVSYAVDLFDKNVYNSKLYIKLNNDVLSCKLSSKNKNIKKIIPKIIDENGLHGLGDHSYVLQIVIGKEKEAKAFIQNISNFVLSYNKSIASTEDKKIQKYISSLDQPKRPVGRPRKHPKKTIAIDKLSARQKIVQRTQSADDILNVDEMDIPINEMELIVETSELISQRKKKSIEGELKEDFNIEEDNIEIE